MGGAFADSRGMAVWMSLYLLAVLGVIVAISGRKTRQFLVLGVAVAVVCGILGTVSFVSSGAKLI